MTRPSISPLTQPSVSTLPQINQLITYRWVIIHAAHGSQIVPMAIRGLNRVSCRSADPRHIYLPPITPPIGRLCRFCQPEQLLGALNCRQLGRIGIICIPTSPQPLPLITLLMGRFCWSVQSLQTLGGLNCRQIGTRPSAIEKRGSMDGLTPTGSFILPTFPPCYCSHYKRYVDLIHQPLQGNPFWQSRTTKL